MNKDHFDLNLLRALQALLDEENVTRAAERLSVTQQAMSGSLARLRDHFGDQLLVRIGRRLSPTPLARSLVKPVREALLRAEIALETTPQFNPLSAELVIRIAMSDYATLVFLPALLRRLAIEAPHISLRTRTISPDIMRQIEAGEIDMCMTAGDWNLYPNFHRTPDFHTATLFSDNFVCAVHRDNMLVGEFMTHEDYLRLRHIAVMFGAGTNTMVQSAWTAQRLSINVAVTAPSFGSQVFMLPGTDLLATVQRRLVSKLAEPLQLRILECPVNIGQLQEILVWHARYDDAPGHRFMRNLMMETAEKLE